MAHVHAAGTSLRMSLLLFCVLIIGSSFHFRPCDAMNVTRFGGGTGSPKRSLVTMASRDAQWSILIPCPLSWERVLQLAAVFDATTAVFEASAAIAAVDETPFAIPCTVAVAAQNSVSTLLVVQCTNTSTTFGLRIRRLMLDQEARILSDECRRPGDLSVARDGLVRISTTESANSINSGSSNNDSNTSNPVFEQVTPSSLWHLDRLDQRDRALDGRYRYTRSGAGVAVYVIDTGVRASHVDFGGRATNLADYSETPPAANGDCNGHGTHVSSTCCGSVYGVAKAASVQHIRVLDCNGDGTFSSVHIALMDVEDRVTAAPHSAVVSMSLSGNRYAAINTLINTLVNTHRVAVVGAAGNSGEDACLYTPGSAAAALVVAASTRTDTLAGFSNAGACADIAAPGTDVTAACATSNTAICTKSGTSMATPIVAGLVAMYMEQELAATPSLTRADGPSAMASVMAVATRDRVDSSGDRFAPLPLAFANIGLPPVAQPPPVPVNDPVRDPPVPPRNPNYANPFYILGRPSDAEASTIPSVLIAACSVVLILLYVTADA